ncbi:ORF MSV200 hypothetical protein [Melanoplus sanguinipes entomopoxvirus]|uniref:Uncharacterized protein n=1 Tax=Melanoplus sanguinipes entomopoxvirus TaxID=83191 RepID=Q9YVP2_MSEPV|nr:ORF MSV200 hypothetical protein [Melanoplus sanguinipes entomopoxvirus]AAC97699.1 ORF MSV200 hypothetical protein [Melanoplus sanguinipes entomopoxvirus 'O']
MSLNQGPKLNSNIFSILNINFSYTVNKNNYVEVIQIPLNQCPIYLFFIDCFIKNVSNIPIKTQ